MESKQNPNSLVLEDRYELTEIIGEGGMAVVYKALDRRLNRYVAVKIMRPEMAQQEEFRQRFFADAGLMIIQNIVILCVLHTICVIISAMTDKAAHVFTRSRPRWRGQEQLPFRRSPSP